MARFLILEGPEEIAPWQRRAVDLLLEDGHHLSGVRREVGGAASRHTSYDIAAASAVDFALSLGRSSPASFAEVSCRWGGWSWNLDGPAPGSTAEAARWAVGRRMPAVAGRLLAWDPADGRRRILAVGRVPTALHSVSTTRTRLEGCCASWLRRGARELADGGRGLEAFPMWQEEAPTPRRPGALELLASLTVGFLRKVRQELFLEEKWTVGILDRPVATLLIDPDLRDVRWLSELAGEDYLADPMGLDEATSPLLAERFLARANRGVIVSVRLEDPGSSPVVLERNHHLSYPILLSRGGQRWCVPEMAAGGAVKLFSADTGSTRFEEAGDMLPETPGVDCTPFFHRGTWWLFGGDARDATHAELHCWLSEDPLGPWRAHPLNPIKTDPLGARSAGPVFEHEGRLYRPGQDCTGSYGRAVLLFEIRELSPTTFREEPVGRIDADPSGPYPHGVHTVSAWAGRTVIDGKRHYLSLRKPVRRLSRRPGGPSAGA